MPAPVFIVFAAVMVLVALGLMLIPLTRGEESSPIAAGALVAVVPLSVSLLYFSYSNWDWDGLTAAPAPHQAASTDVPPVDDMVVRLEQRLEANPDDGEGWQMLGRTYVVMGRYADALDAYRKARDISGDKDVHAITGYAEALAMVRGGMLDDEIGALFDRALQIDPADRKALWYGGLAALESGRPAVARSRWQSLLDAGPPEEMAAILREQIAAADAILGDAAPAVTPEPVVVQGGGVSLTVSLASDLSVRARPDAPVFILARAIGAPGPPLAVVRRTVADLPLQLVLSDDDAMVPGRVLSAHDTVEVVARVALNGTPTAQPGDLSGSEIVPSSGTAAILIDEVVGN